MKDFDSSIGNTANSYELMQVYTDSIGQAILKAISADSTKEKFVNQLVQELKEEQPTISSKLKALKKVGLVFERRVGKHVFYMVNEDVLFAIQRFTDHVKSLFSNNFMLPF
jgi:DNA-binding transcriptional ArsR family regulator